MSISLIYFISVGASTRHFEYLKLDLYKNFSQNCSMVKKIIAFNKSNPKSIFWLKNKCLLPPYKGHQNH